MAYIDFYRNGVRKRITLTQIICNTYTTSTAGIRYQATINGHRRITSLGTEIGDALSLDTLNWNNPPDTKKDASSNLKGYSYINSDNSLELFVTRDSEVNINSNGNITQYTFNGYKYVVYLSVPNTNWYIARNWLIRPNNNLTCTNNLTMVAPNNNRNLNFPKGACYLLGLQVKYNDKDYVAYVLNDVTIYKANQAITGTNDALEGDIWKMYYTACTYEKAGTYLYFSLNTYGNYMLYKGELSTSFAIELISEGADVIDDYRIFRAPDSEFFFTLNSNPTNNDFPKYPDDGDEDNDKPGNGDDEPEGGDGDKDKESDPVPDDDVVESYSITGLMTIYELLDSSLATLGSKLWSENVMSKFLKITGNPIDAIIDLSVSYINFPSSTSQNIMLGNVELDINAPVITNPICDINLGTLSINEFWGDFKDYNPLTKIQIYLPYIGVVDLNTNEIMNSKISLKYRFNLLSNTCVAMISVQKTIDSTNLNSVLYQFEGTFTESIPISAANNNTKISARLSQLGAINTAIRQVGNVAYNNMDKGQKILNAGTSIVNSGINIAQSQIDAHHLDVSRTGSLKGSAGILSIATPYIIIERPIPSYPSSYAYNVGVPLNRTLQLSQLSGFTQILEIFISDFTGTQNEYQELKALLMQGVVF